jgi:hypothetical protein
VSVVINRPTTERLKQTGGVQAGNVHHQHIPADAETLAWNRAREAKRSVLSALSDAGIRGGAP